MSRFEQDVDYNLSESGVHPLKLSELLAYIPDKTSKLMDVELNYPWVNGNPELRENIAGIYNSGQDNIIITVGAIEANYNAINSLLNPGEELIFMVPNYMQLWGVAKNNGYKLKTFRLREEKNWSPDLDELEDKVTEKTKLIAICNPNNPTGYILTDAEMDRIVSIASKVGAWILADEVYSGSERTLDKQTSSFYGLYDKVIAVGSMSKAYGLPGLRIGWAVGPQKMIDRIWARHEYNTISASVLSNELATIALSPEVRPLIIHRTRDYIRKGFPILQKWMDRNKTIFNFTPPMASAIAFIRYNLDINSTVLAERLCNERGVLIVPGDHFGMDNFIRISFGLPEEYLSAGLNRINELIEEIRN
jgi:aspartate/methionine/tyrosine aminotransferase